MGMPFLNDFTSLADRMAPLLIDAAIKGIAALGITGLIVLSLRRSSAAARHWAWLVGIGSLLVLPILTATLPAWRVLPPLYTNSNSAQQSPVTAPQPVLAPGRAVAASEEAPISAKNNAPVPPPGNATVARSHPTPSIEHAVVPISPTPHPSARQSLALPWAFWIVLVWIIGAGLILTYLLLGYFSLWLLQRRCTRIDDPHWINMLDHLRRAVGVRGRVLLLSSPTRTMPMTWGLLQTRLLLPSQAAGWTPEQRKSVLLHELGHVRRRDCITQLIVQIACGLYWVNPLAWFAWRRMLVERERACDDLVLNSGTRASTYAEHLLQSASALSSLRFTGAAVAMARPSTLEERMKAILDMKRNRRTLSASSALATLLILGAMIVPVAVLRGQENPPATPAAAAPAMPPTLAPPPGGISLEERMRLRREFDQQMAAEGGPASRPAAAAARGRGRGIGPMGGRGEMPVPLAPGEGPTCALDATIYEVHLPTDKLGRFNPNDLSAASASAEDFEKSLKELGVMLPLYRANQSVRLSTDYVTVGTTSPYVSSSNVSARGQVMNTIAYAQTGAVFRLAGKLAPAGTIELDMTIEVSALTPGSIESSPGVKPPVFRTATMSRKGLVTAKQPFVILTIDAASTDVEGKAVAYIARVTLGTPEIPATPAGAGQ